MYIPYVCTYKRIVYLYLRVVFVYRNRCVSRKFGSGNERPSNACGSIACGASAVVIVIVSGEGVRYSLVTVSTTTVVRVLHTYTSVLCTGHGPPIGPNVLLFRGGEQINSDGKINLQYAQGVRVLISRNRSL